MTARASPFNEEVMSKETDETAHEVEELEHRLAAGYAAPGSRPSRSIHSGSVWITPFIA